MPGKSRDKTHDHIADLLFKLVDAYPDYKEKECRSKTNPILIKFKKDFKEYHPDIWAKTRKTKEIDIYEVWNTEEEREACSDILHAACIDNIRYFHIICVENPRFPDQSWDKNYAKKLVRIFLNHIRNDSNELLLKPENVSYAEIRKNELRDDKRILQSLRKQLDF